MVTSLNGRSISNGASASMSASWEGADTSGKFSISGPSLNYGAAYASRHNSASGYNFDTPDDIFIEPSLTENSGLSNLTRHPTATTVEDALTDNTGWQFSFNMEGIGPVKATVTGISYSTNDYQEEDEGRWWSWYNYTYNGQPRQERRGHSYSAGNTLQGLMNSLTGNTGSLPKSAGGMNDGTASYTMSMSITSDSPYSYGTGSSSTVGSMSLSFTVGQSDTQQTVLDKINRALNDTTVLDFSKSSSGNDSGSFSYMTVGSNTIEEPIWGGVCNIDIQAGPEADHVIDIMYDELGLYQLGIYTANTLTQDDATAAIDQLKTAEYVVSEQRAQFGAYQNRLEHAYKVNKNAEENTQYAESQIRDTDMAKEMVQNAKDNILQQAGQTMLAQANQSRQGMLQLLS
ncbi:MAG: hypothetical protein K6E84_00110 [Lachnospiraceae bacterium]|nr:hypothetical protein [Lachnospiraceae bacterium]